MHSNGGRGLVPEATLPAVGESRRAGDSAALMHRRSFGGKGLIAGANGEWLGTVSVMGFPRLVVRLRSRLVAGAPFPSERSETTGRCMELHRRLERVRFGANTKCPNENRMFIGHSVEGNSGMGAMIWPIRPHSSCSQIKLERLQWVNRVGLTMSRRCPVYFQLRTYCGVAANRREGP